MFDAADRAPRVVLSHPASPPFVRHDVMALCEQGMLAYFATTFLDHPDYTTARLFRRLAKTLRPSWIKQLERRAFHEIPMELVQTRAPLEFLRTLFSAVLDWPVTTDLIWEIQEHDFDRWVARNLPPDIDAVVTYEHGALSTLRQAKRQRAYTFLVQPAQHFAFYTSIFNEQIRRYPEIANSVTALNTGRKAKRRDARKSAELALADCVICNSSFTRRTLIDGGVAAEKIEVIPYGFPPVAPPPRTKPLHPVVFMNAGTQNLRKGLHLLYRAWRFLNFSPEEAELWLIGKMLLPESLRRDLPGRVRIMDSIPHRELLEIYGAASVFVLPSLADGFGMVITEAMSRGLPVIATENTGALDLIKPGVNGFIIPPGDEAALARQMRWCVDHAEQLARIGDNARRSASEWQWPDYRAALSEIVRRRAATATTTTVGRAS